MKKITLLKSLLVAAALLVGTSAWADEGDIIYSNDFSTKDETDFATWMATGKVPTGYSHTILGRKGTFSIESGNLLHTPTAGKKNSNVYNGEFGTLLESITTATRTKNYIVEFDITLAITGHNAHTALFELSDENKKVVLCMYATHTRSNSSTGATSYGYIVGGDNGFAVKEASITDGKNANTEGSIGNGTQIEIANVNGTTGSKTYHVKLDAQTNGLAKLTIKEGETTIVDEAVVGISEEKGLKYVYLADHSYSTNAEPSVTSANSTITIDNLSIVEGAAAVVTTANYTVKYVANISDIVTEIKDAEVRINAVGGSITLLDSDKADIWYNDSKYVYSSDDASSKTVAEDNSTVVTVTFVEPTSYTYSVIDNLGNTLASGKSYGGNVAFYVPYYAFKDGKFYKNPTLSSGTLSYGAGSISNIQEDTEITVTYTEEENTNVVFFSEAENLEGVTVQDDNYTHMRMSNGKAGYFTSQTAFVNLPKGVYSITSSTRAGTTTFYAGTVGNGTEIGKVTSSGSVVTTTSDLFLADNSDIYTSVGHSGAYFDYVIIRKLYDVTDASKVVGNVDYSSEYMSVHHDLTLSRGETATLRFKNYGKTDQNYYNWALRFYNADIDNAYTADNRVNGNTPYTWTDFTYSMKKDGADMDWDDFKADMVNATVNMAVKYDATGHLFIDATAVGVNHTYTYTFTFNNTITGNLNLELGIDHNWLDILSSSKAVSTVAAEVSDAGYATYVNNDYDLDFSETSIEAYKVKVSTKGKATLKKVDNVPVGTPVLLYKDGGATEAIPVMTGAAAVTDNDLVAGTGAAVATTDGGNTNMILNNGSAGIGFYFANGQTVAANRAYLQFDSSLAPVAEARMSMVFGDEGTTAISGIKNSELSIDNSVYNLNGQKVMQPTKGLYIVNGKKVIVK